MPGLCQHAWAACEETAIEPWFNRHPQALWFELSFQINHSERTFHLFLEDSEFLKIGKTHYKGEKQMEVYIKNFFLFP